MDKRLLLVPVVVGVVLVVVWSRRTTEAPAPAEAPLPAQELSYTAEPRVPPPSPKAPVDTAVKTEVPLVASTEAADDVPIPQPEAPPVAPPVAPVVDMPPASEPIVGQSPVPIRGKPVAAVDITWDLQPDPSTPERYHGTITAINRSGTGRTVLLVEALGAVRLLGEAQTSVVWQRDEILTMPVSVHLMGAAGQAELIVTVRVEAEAVRSRVISIILRGATENEETTEGVPKAATPRSLGEHVLTGSDGQPVHFVPAAGEP